MITIYNRKQNHKIEIDDSLDWVQVNPKTYEDRPHFIIELSNGFQFLDHATKCKDCSSMKKSSKMKGYFLNKKKIMKRQVILEI